MLQHDQLQKVTMLLPHSVWSLVKKHSKRGKYSSFVTEAIIEKIRSKKREQLIALAGKVSMDDNWQKQEDLEILEVQ